MHPSFPYFPTPLSPSPSHLSSLQTLTMPAKSPIYDIKISSIGPANVTGSDFIYEPENVDLAMKLHYLRGIYYFKSDAFEGLTTLVIKEPMFMWLNQYPMTSGRFRRSESGRPYIKCNDCGVRFLEGKCDKTLDEWLDVKDVLLENHLFPNQVIGPELGFSPLIFIQLTKFKCGGMAVGISWAHVLGDAFSVAEFINALGRAVSGQEMHPPMNLSQSHTKSNDSYSQGAQLGKDPISLKRVDPVGDNWVYSCKVNMDAFSFNVTSTQLTHLHAKLGRNGPQFSTFHALSALIWHCIARIRGEESSNVVTICTGGKRNEEAARRTLSNSQIVSVVTADFHVSEAALCKLASLLKNGAIEENEKIDEVVGRENGLIDFIVYGANLTFVNLEEATFYEFDYRGQKPVSVSYRIDGVDEQGAILMQPWPKAGGEGWSVTTILPENEIAEVKEELGKEGLIA